MSTGNSSHAEPASESAASLPALFGDLYSELHRLAARTLRRTGAATVSATTLLHDAYLDLAAGRPEFADEARFFAYASRAMRGLVIDHIRERRALKRGGAFHLTSLDTAVADSIA